MTRAIEPKRLGDLVTLLDQLERLHDELAVLAKVKVDAMKRADMRSLQESAGRERSLVTRIQEREGLRRQLMDRIGEHLGLPPRSARLLTVSQLVSRIPQEQRAAILEAAEALRGAVSRVAQANRVAGMVARGLVDHLGRVFAAIGPSRAQEAGYSGQGAMVAQMEHRIFETVG